MKFSTQIIFLLAASSAHAAVEDKITNDIPHLGNWDPSKLQRQTAAVQSLKEENDKPIRIGSAQVEPVHWDLNGTIDKLCDYMAAAGDAKMDLVTFSEGFMSGYPWFNFFANTFDIPSNSKIERIFAENSIQIGSPEMQRVQECIAAAGVNTVLPINELDYEGSQAAVFNTALFIDKSGEVVGSHRKTLPSFTERFWWTQGDGTDLVVVDMPDVGRVCSLLCWESYMVLARYTLMAQGCEFLMVPTQDLGPVWENHIGSMAREGRWYVIGQGQLMSPYNEAMQRSAISRTEFDDKGSQWYPTMLSYFNNIYQCEEPETKQLQNTTASAEETSRLRGKKQLVGTVDTEDSLVIRPDPVAIGGGKCAKFFMDGGMTIADPYGRFLVEPVHSNFPDTVQRARSGCKHSLEAGMPEENHCELFEVDGYNGDEEFLIVTHATRGEVLASKTYQDNVGNYARSDIWKVTWDNAPRNVLFETKDGKGNEGHDLMHSGHAI